MMKHFYLVLAGMVLLSFNLNAQCADVTLSSQSDVDSFAATYGCTSLTGQLKISGSDITNLDGLSGLTSVGFLLIYGNNALTNIDGLRHLGTVGTGGCLECPLNGLAIINNTALHDLDGLSSLTSVGGALKIENNPSLENINGLNQLRSIRDNDTFNTGSISISMNAALLNIEGLRSVTNITSGISIVENQSLTSLDGLEGITTIRKTGLTISNNDALVDISGLKNITSINRYFEISGNDALADLDGLSSVTSIPMAGPNSYLKIKDNASLTNIDGLSSVADIGSPSLVEVTVTGNSQLTSGCGIYRVLDQLNSCHGCDARITISNNAPGVSKDQILANGPCAAAPVTCGGDIRLTTQAAVDAFPSEYGCNIVTGMLLISGTDITHLDSLISLRSAGVLIVGNNPLLEDLDGLNNLETAGGFTGCQCLSSGLQINDNPLLKNLDALASLTSVPGDLQVFRNQSLLNINSLSALTSIGLYPNTRSYNSIVIEDNAALITLAGLNNLDSIPGRVSIRNNDALVSLDGFKNTRTIGRGFYIAENDAMINIDGLGSLEEIYNGFAIDDNPSLQNLDALGSLRKITGTPGASFRISNNTSLTDVDSLSSLTDFDGFGRQLTVTGNTSLTRGCGFYNLIAVNFCDTCPGTVTFSGNGAAFTREGIIADGPCEEDGNPEPGSLTFNNVTDNSMSVMFHSSPVRDGYITLMRAFESALPDEAPVNGTSYSVGNVIGCCSIVVGFGMDSILNIVYLEPDIDYYFDVIPFENNNGSYTYDTAASISGHQRTLPRTQPYPNPFVEEVVIPFTIAEEGASVRIMIVDQLGRTVSEVVNDRFAMGKHEVVWTRTDIQGNRVGNGIYVYSIIMNQNQPVKGMFVAK